MRPGELASPVWKSVRLGLAVKLLQLEKSPEQVAQGGHELSGFGPADSRSVLAQADIPAVVRSVFNRPPVVPNGWEQLLGAILTWGGAGAVVAIFFRFFGDFALTQFWALPPHRQELPATVPPDLFGAEADSLEAPTH